MMEELGEFAQKLQYFFSGKRSEQHWGGGATSRPVDQTTLWRELYYHLGRREAHEAARYIAEERLLCGPGANLPR